MSLTFIAKRGPEIATVFDDLALLRITVFRDFPYLYEGTVAYEKDYLQTYARSEGSLLFAVYDGTQMVGATTCIPMVDETEEVQKPFLEAGYNLSKIFYFGESILLPAYRGMGLGHRFFDERETHAKSFGSYELTCFCSVNRPENHPAKPVNYRSNDLFWGKRGYHKEPQLVSEMEWQDVGSLISTSKSLTFWCKSLY